MRPLIGEAFFLNDFSIGFGTVTFYNAKVTTAPQNYVVNLQEIKVGINLPRLITFQFDPFKLVKYIKFYKPQLVLYEDSRRDSLQTKDSLSADFTISGILTHLEKFPDVKNIKIENGEILWRARSGKRIPLFKQLEGFIVNVSTNALVMNLQGRLFGADESDVVVKGMIDFKNQNWRSQFFLNNCLITSRLPFVNEKNFVLNRAKATGTIYLSSSSFDLAKLQLGGKVTLKDVEGLVFNQKITIPSSQLEFQDQSILIPPLQGFLEKGEATFSGRVDSVLHPLVDWQLKVRGYAASDLKKSHDIFEYVEDGTVAGEFHFSGALRNMTIEGTATSPAIQYAVIPFHNVQMRLVYHDRLLKFPFAEADFKKFRTRGNGWVNFNSDTLNFNFYSDLTVPQKTFKIFDELNQASFKLLTSFNGDFSTKAFGGYFQYRFEQPDSMLFSGQGPFKLNDQHFVFNLYSQDLPDTLLVQGTIDELFSDPYFKILEFKKIPVQQLTSNPLIQSLAARYNFHAYFAGPYDYLNGKLNVYDKRKDDLAFSLFSNIKDVFNDKQRFKGKFVGQTRPLNIEGNFEIDYQDSGISILLDSPGLLDGKLFVAYDPNGPFNGKIEVEKFSIKNYFPSATDSTNGHLQGFLEGLVQISGTVAKPDVRFDFNASQFIINEVGYYATRLKGKFEHHTFSFDNCQVLLNEVPVFNATLAWDVLTDSLKLHIEGQQIESNFLAVTLFKDPQLIKGIFSYSLDATGTLSAPVIYADVQVRNGVFSGYPFDLISLSFADSLMPGGKFYNPRAHILSVKKFIYVNKAEYTIEGKGLISFEENGPIDVRLNVKGNVLAELPKISSYFRDPSSNGYLAVHVIGTRMNPFFDSFKLQILDGSLQFESVLPKLTNIQADIELKPGSRFVSIKNISGNLKDRWARIYNLQEVQLDSATLAPWNFEDIGLNFGVFVLETDPRGIPLSIPGLMAERDMGYFVAGGQTPAEKFYFAGPPDRPYARGKLVLKECRVTFPFLTDEEEEPGLVVEFLRNVNWDVLALAGSGTRYFVDIPAYIGKVYMDLNIDNTSKGLLFTGRWNDNSFRVEGSVESSRGRVEYLDVNFRVEKFGAVFNRFELYPEVYGRAYTTVRDSTGDFPRDIYLVLYAIDPETGKEVSRGRWEDFRFKLTSSDPTIGETQEQVLAYLGYSVKNLGKKAGSVGLTMTENLLFRPLVRPLERRLERGLGLDYVRLRSNFAQNLFYFSFLNRPKILNQPIYLNYGVNQNVDPALLLLQSSEITVGKYLFRNMYLTYSGQLVSVYEEAKLGMNHRFELEYRLLKNLLLEVEYDKFLFNPVYYNQNYLTDFRIRLRHSIIFNLRDIF